MHDDSYIIPKWICIIAKLYGFWPHPISLGAKIPSHRLKPSAKDWLWSLFTGIVYIVCTLIHVDKMFESNVSDSTLAIATAKVSFGLVAIYAVITANWRHDVLAKLIEVFRLVHIEVSDRNLCLGLTFTKNWLFRWNPNLFIRSNAKWDARNSLEP